MGKSQKKNNDNAKRSLPELYQLLEECCGCGVCAYVCPCKAIELSPDDEGFLYPVVDDLLCIRCGRCVDACSFKPRAE